MCSFKLGLLSAGLAVWVLFVDMSTTALRVAVAEAEPTPTSSGDTSWNTSGDRLLSAQKQIVVRTEQGSPVPGVYVQLAPADAALGGQEGRETGAALKKGITNSQGTAAFTGLGQWTWMVSFSGTFEGKAIRPQREQGRSPYGRTRSGGGFPVLVQAQEEDAAATPVVVNGVAQPEVQPSLFVLVPVQDSWTPALDLALPGELPQPLHEISAPEATQTSSGASAGTLAHVTREVTHTTSMTEAANTPPTVGALEDAVRWFYALPVAVALFAFYRAWQERRSHRKDAD